MKLSELTLPISYEEAKKYALIFDINLSNRLKELYNEHGSDKIMPAPVALINDKFMLCADLLTEVMPGGMLADMWEAANKEVLLNSVEVISMEEAISLIKIEISSI